MDITLFTDNSLARLGENQRLPKVQSAELRERYDGFDVCGGNAVIAYGAACNKFTAFQGKFASKNGSILHRKMPPWSSIAGQTFSIRFLLYLLSRQPCINLCDGGTGCIKRRMMMLLHIFGQQEGMACIRDKIQLRFHAAGAQ